MIIRPDLSTDQFITISQTSHSWISGQIARAWGNEIFSGFSPFEQMCYAAEQHDIGFLRWEDDPVLNASTGLPYTFEDLPAKVHFEIWRTGISQLRLACHYASLVVSLHFCNLCERFHSQSAGRSQSEAGRFLEEQRAFQEAARKFLRDDPFLKNALDDDVLAYHRDLIGSWDFFSLQLCRGCAQEFTLPQVPIWGNKKVDVVLREADSAENIWEVAPWPFNVETLNVVCEGRLLREKFVDGEKMRLAFRNTDRKTVCFNLRP